MLNLEISTDPTRLDLDVIHGYLSSESYWTRGRTRAQVEVTIQNSLSFGGYESGRQVAFGRVVTDSVVIGYLADVFVIAACRGRGVGTALLGAMLEHPTVSALQVLLLRTSDAHKLYEKFGFARVPAPHELLGRYRTPNTTGVPE